MPRIDRRRYLAAAATGLSTAIAGCSGILSNSQTVEVHDSISRSGTTVTLQEVTVRDSFLYSDSGSMWRTANDRHTAKDLFATVAVRGQNPPAPSDFELVTGEESIVHGSQGGGYPLGNGVNPTHDIYDVPPRYDPESGIFAGPVLFGFDYLAHEPEALYVTWGGDQWRLRDDHRRAVSRPPPTFSILSLDVPESHSGESALDVGFEVENISDEDGTFWGALHVTSPRASFVDSAESAIPFQISIDAHESTTWYTTFEPEFLATVSRLEFRLVSLAGDREFSVEITD